VSIKTQKSYGRLDRWRLEFSIGRGRHGCKLTTWPLTKCHVTSYITSRNKDIYGRIAKLY